MKTCQCCGAAAKDNVAACALCGEASWVLVEATPAPEAPTAPEPRHADIRQPSQKKR